MGSLYKENQIKEDDYNEEPVFYCAQCLSLKIKGIPGDSDMNYCDECNSIDIRKANIEDWEAMYKKKYGYKFLERQIKWKRKTK